MSTNTTNFAMGKAVDGDNAKTYLETTLGAALDAIDAHRHTGTTSGLTIQTGGLAANAVTQTAMSQVATGSTASLTAVDTGLTVTMTTTGGDVLIMASVVSSNSGANTVLFNLNKDGSNAANLAKVTASGAAATHTTSLVYRDAVPSAGSHTYKIQYLVSAGTETIDTAVNSTLVVVELKK